MSKRRFAREFQVTAGAPEEMPVNAELPEIGTPFGSGLERAFCCEIEFRRLAPRSRTWLVTAHYEIEEKR